jgi:hypothetical protein
VTSPDLTRTYIVAKRFIVEYIRMMGGFILGRNIRYPDRYAAVSFSPLMENSEIMPQLNPH